jgi:prepilin peptidase CpaA
MGWMPLPFVVIAAAYDLRSREIADWVPAALLAWAIVATACALNGVGWLELAGGAAIGIGIGLPLFALGALGGGDVKLVTALGAALGPADLLATLFWVAIVGGLLAVVAWWRGQRELAYVPAIALGLLIHTIRMEILKHASAS